MPVLSMFEGIIIQMHNTKEHNPPHFHAVYQGKEAVFNLDGELTEGSMPVKKQKLVQAWVILHQDELIANWELAMMNEPLYKIEPLR